MKRPSKLAIIAPASGNILSVSPDEEDHTALERLVNDAAWVAPAETLWQLSQARTLASALTALRRVEYAVIICERDLRPGSWKELLEITQWLAQPPLLIVSSRLADEYLWAEALHLGAHDVLAKPFCPAEVIRVINLACLRWHRERQHAGRSMVVEMAASGV